MSDGERIPVWTLMQGSGLLKEFGAISMFEDDMLCAVRDDPKFCIFQVPHKKMLEHYNILVFVGLIPQGGVSDKVIRLNQWHSSEIDYAPNIPCAISVAKASAALLVSKNAPFDSWIDTLSASERRFIRGGQLVQMAHRSVLAFPKGNERGTIITFRYPSLEPKYRFVQSLPNELIVRSASSY